VLLAAPAPSPVNPGARSPEPDDDFALMRSAQQGDVDAFAAIYDRHAPAALALGARMLMSAPDAQDLLQDVFLEAWQHVREYDAQRASVRTWLLVRMRSRALDRLARRTREDLLQRALLAVRSSHVVHTPPDERSLAMHKALEQLDEHVRAALSLTYFWGLTAPEIGEQLKVAEGTVRSRLARGLQELERLLSEVGNEGVEHE
jgi:RNA polymerase sigma-70 factor (ECF subfamily)